MDSLRSFNDVSNPSPVPTNVKIKCLTGTHNGVSRFPKLNECAHFHYDIVEIGCLKAGLCEEKSENQEIKNYITTQPSDDKASCFCISVKTNGKEWKLRRSYDDFYMLDRQVHRCIYDRKYSQLPELPISEELLDFISSSEQLENSEDGLRSMLIKYLDRFSILAGNLINCGPVLNWFELDNRGNRLLVPEESAINTPAVGAAYVIKRYSAQATDEISFNVGDMVSVIDMPPPEDSIWWRGKKGFEVGFFPRDCVEIISDKIPKAVSIPKSAPMKPKPVLRKRGKLITFFRSFIISRPSKRKLKQRGILKERVFGCDLGEHLLNSGHDIPIVLKHCSEFIEEFGVVDGIYRLSGVTSNIQKLRVAFDEERVPDLHNEAFLQDIHCVASLLKMYFRELPNPLLTYQLYDKFVSAVQANDESRLIMMRDVVHQLPPPHYRTLEYLIKHLARVSAHGARTGMGPKNIAIVWAPNLLRSKDLGGGSVAALHVIGVQAVLTEYLIRYVDLIFNDKMPMFTQNLSEETSCKEHESPKRTRPKSLAISTPTKLLSLEEARSRVLTTSLTGTNTQVDPKFIDVGGGPANLPEKYHTIIDLPGSKRGSGKLKKSPTGSGWKSFFSKTRTPSGGSQREKGIAKSSNPPLLQQFSVNTFYQENTAAEGDIGYSQNKRLRTVKSAESLISSVDYSHSTSDEADESASEGFKYTPLVSSRSRLSSEALSESNDMVDVESSKVDSIQMTVDNDDEKTRNDEAAESDTEEVRKIKIEIGSNKDAENLTSATVIKDSSESRKNSLTTETNTKCESVSPKAHKLSLKQKFKQAFTSPPSIRRVVQVSDESQSPFKRNPSSFREKIVKTFSPESLRKKQQSEGSVVSEDGGRISPTAPPRRKQRKKANIEEDDSSPDLYYDNKAMGDLDEDDVSSLEIPEVITSPDSAADSDGINETVTVEVHAVEEGLEKPWADLEPPLTDFEFEKSFMTKSEKSLLEEVTSELAQKTSTVFPSQVDESDFQSVDASVEKFDELKHCNEEERNESEACKSLDSESGKELGLQLDEADCNKDVCPLSKLEQVPSPEEENLEQFHFNVNDSKKCDIDDCIVPEYSEEVLKTSLIDNDSSLYAGDKEIEPTVTTVRSDALQLSEADDNVFEDASKPEIISVENFDVPESSNWPIKMNLINGMESSSKSLPRVNSWCPASYNDDSKTSRDNRWSYPPPNDLSYFDESKRKFESEIGRDLIHDRRMQKEIQAKYLKNDSDNNAQTFTPFVSAVLFKENQEPGNAGSLKEPVEADTATVKSVSNLPEVSAKTGSTSSEKSIEEEEGVELMNVTRTPTSPQRSMIPRMISPTKQSNSLSSATGLPVSPVRNNRETTEIRRSRRNNAMCEFKNSRNSDPNGTSNLAEKNADVKSKRNSEPELMSKSFPPRTSFLSKQEAKTSVKELLNKFEKQPETNTKNSSQHACLDKPSPTNDSTLKEPDLNIVQPPQNRSHQSYSHRHSLGSVHSKKTSIKSRVKSHDYSSSPQILENSDIVISDMFVNENSSDMQTKEDPVLQRPTSLFPSDSGCNLKKSEEKENVISPCESSTSSHISSQSGTPKESPVVSPCSTGSNQSLDANALSSGGDITDAARRERINRYKEERRAQLREKIKLDSNLRDDKTSPSKKSWKRTSLGSSPVKHSSKSSPNGSEDGKMNQKRGSISRKSSSPSNNDLNQADKDSSNSVCTEKSSHSEPHKATTSKDKEMIIIENIPPKTSPKKVSPRRSEKPQPKGIKERVALFEKDKEIGSKNVPWKC